MHTKQACVNPRYVDMVVPVTVRMRIDELISSGEPIPEKGAILRDVDATDRVEVPFGGDVDKNLLLISGHLRKYDLMPVEEVYSVPGLLGHTEYYVAVAARNSVGLSEFGPLHVILGDCQTNLNHESEERSWTKNAGAIIALRFYLSPTQVARVFAPRSRTPLNCVRRWRSGVRWPGHQVFCAHIGWKPGVAHTEAWTLDDGPPLKFPA